MSQSLAQESTRSTERRFESKSEKAQSFAFCTECGDKITLPKADKPIQMTKHEAVKVEARAQAADQRSRFEQVLFRLKTYVSDKKIASPECFISYAWGNHDQEHWVERTLATDLQKAGITVVLDRWENARSRRQCAQIRGACRQVRSRDRGGHAALPEEV